jgi:hypothetical protein
MYIGLKIANFKQSLSASPREACMEDGKSSLAQALQPVPAFLSSFAAVLSRAMALNYPSSQHSKD